MIDKHGNEIKLGDILDSDDGYSVIVSEYDGGGWFGQLICEPSHYCASIPYALNEGRGYTNRQTDAPAGEGHSVTEA